MRETAERTWRRLALRSSRGYRSRTPQYNSKSRETTSAALFILVSSFAREHHFDGASEKIEVEPRGPVANVVGIERHAFGVGGVVASGNLPQASDPGKNLGIEQVSGAVFRNLGLHDGARSDQAHVA